MPELPEVETIARGLRATIVGRTIHKAQALHPRIVRFAAPHEAAGKTICAVDRRGKLLRIHLSDARMLVVHLKMSGRLWVVAEGTARPAHTHFVATLDAGTELVFVDPRRFGFVGLLDEAAWNKWEFARTLGPEPLESTPQDLATRLDLPASKRAIKAALLDQRVIAGVGNIYADESLFAAKIHPTTPTGTLSAAQRLRLACAVQDVLHAAIAAGGSTINDYRNAMGAPGLFQERFAVHGRAGLPCPQCGTLLTRLRVAGRGTVVCPRCQGTGSAAHTTPRTR